MVLASIENTLAPQRRQIRRDGDLASVGTRGVKIYYLPPTWIPCPREKIMTPGRHIVKQKKGRRRGRDVRIAAKQEGVKIGRRAALWTVSIAGRGSAMGATPAIVDSITCPNVRKKRAVCVGPPHVNGSRKNPQSTIFLDCRGTPSSAPTLRPRRAGGSSQEV